MDRVEINGLVQHCTVLAKQDSPMFICTCWNQISNYISPTCSSTVLSRASPLRAGFKFSVIFLYVQLCRSELWFPLHANVPFWAVSPYVQVSLPGLSPYVQVSLSELCLRMCRYLFPSYVSPYVQVSLSDLCVSVCVGISFQAMSLRTCKYPLHICVSPYV